MNFNPSTTRRSSARTLARAIAIWALLAVLETLHGTVRTILLVPMIGDQRSRQVGVFSGSLIILFVAWLTIRWIGARSSGQRIAVGLVWMTLMFGFEIGLGRALGLSWKRILSDYNPTEGGFMLLGMGMLLFAPLIASRMRLSTRTPGK
jgi:hypothetical protein